MRLTRIVLLVSLCALVVVPTALALRFTDDSYNMPTGVVGQPYSKQFNGAGGCGPALPYQYSLIGGKLPAGLSLSSTGLISGTPTQAGSSSFWVDLSDQNPPSANWCRPSEAQREFTITVVDGTPTPAPALKISQSSLTPAATVANQPYSFQFTASGGGTQTWTLQSGSLPAGLTLSSSGLLSGTAAATGDFTFKVQVSDGTRTDVQSFTLTIVAPLKITPIESGPSAEVMRPLQLQLTATGGKAPYRWSPAAGTALPAGVTLDPSTGALSGRPTVPGSYSLHLTVSDSLGLSEGLTVELVVAPKLVATSRKLSTKVGRLLHALLNARGGVSPQTWTIVRGKLPAGIHLSRHTGRLSGRARHTGTTTVLVRVRDAVGAVSTARLVVRVGS